MARRVLVFIWILLLALPCSPARADPGPEEGLLLRAQPFWERRDEPEMMKQAAALYEEALLASPGDPLVLERLAMAELTRGENFLADKKERKAAYEKGMEYASDLCRAAPDSPAGDFWYLVNRLCHENERGFLRALSFLPECKSRLLRVMERDKFFSDGGPQRIWAQIILHTPGLFRSSSSFGRLEDAERMLLEALADEPRFLMTRLTLARVYLAMKKKDKARAQLELIVKTPLDDSYEFAPENRMDAKRAEALLKSLQ